MSTADSRNSGPVRGSADGVGNFDGRRATAGGAVTVVRTPELVDAADRFRAWSRSEHGAQVCLGVAEGSIDAESKLIAAFCHAVNPPARGPLEQGRGAA